MPKTPLPDRAAQAFGRAANPDRAVRAPYKPRPAGSVKAATSLLVTAVGGTPVAAEHLGCSQTHVQRWTDPAEPGRTMPVHRVMTLQRIAGIAPVTEFLAAEMGGVVLWLPGADGGDVARDFAALGEMASQLFADYGASLAGPESPGRVDSREAARMVPIADRLLAAIAHLRGDLKAIIEREDEGNG